MIINSGELRSQPDEVAELLRKAMGLKAGAPLRREAIREFLEREGASKTEEALLLRLYLEENNLLSED